MEDLAQRYGKWQNEECQDMKAHLSELDPDGREAACPGVLGRGQEMTDEGRAAGHPPRSLRF